MSNLSENLRLLRKHKSLQQEDMQEHLGISRATWSNYELGKTEPKIDVLLAIAAFFDLTVDKLLKDDLRLAADLVPERPLVYPRSKRNKTLQNNLSAENMANEVHTPDMEETLLQQILTELKMIRQQLTQQ